MKLTIAQLNLTHDLNTNKNSVLDSISHVGAGEWILFPECTLTGYFPEEETFLQGVTPEVVEAAITEITEAVKDRGCFCILGTARHENDAWYNAAVLISPEGIVDRYQKFALSELDKKHFAAGPEPKTYEMGGVTFGVQICRDLIFPEQWQSLKKQGAQIIFHSNNAIKPYDDVWEHIILARAIENQLFVASSNNGAQPGELASYIVSPAGTVVLKTDKQQQQIRSAEFDLVNFTSPY